MRERARLLRFVRVGGGRVLGCPASEQAGIRLQGASAWLGRADFPTVEGDAGGFEDLGNVLLCETVCLA
ncbi:hypothetical protein GCM10023323_68140 [Streptomyces thinghirensis]|uniref:Uncharacterized protein n=1 Tax=Streptomyces thinghirensis TaxID=551547 RepID=A0ABP9TDK2_9ACTN